MKQFKGINLLCLLLSVYFASCDNEPSISDNDENTHTCEMYLLGSMTDYLDNITRASYEWTVNDVIYLRFDNGSNIATGQALFNGKKWILTYSGELAITGGCDAYYIKSDSRRNETSITLDYNSIVYSDEQADYTFSDGAVYLTSTLSPKLGRLRFKGKANEQITISGISYYTSLNVSSDIFESSSQSITLKTDNTGFTPYIYGTFADNSNTIQLTNTSDKGCVFTRSCDNTVFAKGHSGYMIIPQSSNHNNWTMEEKYDIWDGTKASSFAGGSGTSIDPYLIETGAQLILMKDHPDDCFKLMNNIDLNNQHWPNFSFTGIFDGNGFCIKNLSKSYQQDNLGFWSKCSGTVQNLTIKGVNISASKNNKIGCIAGEANNCTIENCHVIFTNGSKLLGNEYVGGIIGYAGRVNYKNSSVQSEDESFVITGQSHIGGVAGYQSDKFKSYPIISNCVIHVNLLGEEAIGGYFGEFYDGSSSDEISIYDCLYKGQLSGNENVGGLVGTDNRFGTHYLVITSCLADVDIDVQSGKAAGFIGNNSRTKVIINSSYVKGNIRCDVYANSVGGFIGYNGNMDKNNPPHINLSYSTIECESINYLSIGGYYNKSYFDNPSVANNCAAILGDTKTKLIDCMIPCTNITDFIRSCYSEYDSYWNYNNTWIWEGKIDGKEVSVSCPKLAWEE